MNQKPSSPVATSRVESGWATNSPPRISVFGLDGVPIEEVWMPAVFTAPIRPDIVRTVQANLNKNLRQPYAVSDKAGHNTAATSWGTGRAVARIPRVPGLGSQRSGQGAFGNMCRGGHMYAPTKVWRSWHRKVNRNIKRFAVCSALSASALPALIMARGHKIDTIPEVPLVLDDAVESVSTTSKLLTILRAVGVDTDVKQASASRKIRKGRGKKRGNRYSTRKSCMLVCANDNGISRAIRNLPGVDIGRVEHLNILKLAPGGHVGRLILWTKSALKALDHIVTRTQKRAVCTKTAKNIRKGYLLPRACMRNSDIARIINSDEVQSLVKMPNDEGKKKHAAMKKNPQINNRMMLKLKPFVERENLKEEEKKPGNNINKLYRKYLLTDNDYRNEGFESFQDLYSTPS